MSEIEKLESISMEEKALFYHMLGYLDYSISGVLDEIGGYDIPDVASHENPVINGIITKCHDMRRAVNTLMDGFPDVEKVQTEIERLGLSNS